MTTTVRNGRRGTTAVILAVAGGALALATWIGGARDLALVLVAIYVVASVGAWLWAGRDTDAAAALRAGGDERQRRIDRDSTALAGLAMVTLAVVGSIVSAARDDGNIGVYGLFAAVGGLVYVVSFAVLSRRG